MKIFCLIEGGILQHIAVQGAEAPEIHVMDRDNGDLYPYAQHPGTYTNHKTAADFYADMQDSCNPPAGFVWPSFVGVRMANGNISYLIHTPTQSAGVFWRTEADESGALTSRIDGAATPEDATTKAKANGFFPISFFELPEAVRLSYEFWAVNTEGQEAE